MPTLEERVAYLEGQVSDQSHALVEVRDAVRHLELRVDARFEAGDRRIEAGFETVDRRFESIERKFEGVDRRFDGVDRRIDALDNKVSSQFVWLVGIQVTMFVTFIAALLARP